MPVARGESSSQGLIRGDRETVNLGEAMGVLGLGEAALGSSRGSLCLSSVTFNLVLSESLVLFSGLSVPQPLSALVTDDWLP